MYIGIRVFIPQLSYKTNPFYHTIILPFTFLKSPIHPVYFLLFFQVMVL